MKTIARLLCGAALAAFAIAPASAKELNKVGISVGLLGNPFFVATIKGIEDAAKKINPKVEVTSVSAGPPFGGLYLKAPSSGGLCDGVMKTPSANPLPVPRCK